MIIEYSSVRMIYAYFVNVSRLEFLITQNIYFSLYFMRVRIDVLILMRKTET